MSTSNIRYSLFLFLCLNIVPVVDGHAGPVLNLQKIKSIVCQNSKDCKIITVKNRRFRYINKWVVDVKALIDGHK